MSNCDGVPTVALEMAFESIGQRSTLIVGYVDGRHLVLEVGSSLGGTTTYSAFDEPVRVEEPPAEETVDVEDLPDLP
jgi:hypothetical protein